MSPSVVLVLFLIAMVISIVVGNKFDAIGLISMTFAYIIGVFLLGMKASAVVGLFPAKILFTIDKSYYMGLYFLCFSRHNIRKFVNISPIIFGR